MDDQVRVTACHCSPQAKSVEECHKATVSLPKPTTKTSSIVTTPFRQTSHISDLPSGRVTASLNDPKLISVLERNFRVDDPSTNVSLSSSKGLESPHDGFSVVESLSAKETMMNGECDDEGMGIQDDLVKMMDQSSSSVVSCDTVTAVSKQSLLAKRQDCCCQRIYAKQTSMFHSGALLPRGASTSYIACKDELMASLTAVVTSGSPSASLRKTHGPGKVGPKEVFSFRRMSQASTSPIQSPVTCQSSIKPFDAGGILSQVRETDASGDNIPDWKRQLLARKAAEGAEKAFSRQRKVDERGARFKGMPLWKRALIEERQQRKSNER